MRRRERERIERLELDGTMDRRRAELRAWFATHPQGTPMQAVRDLSYSHPDHMRVVADSILMDLVRAEPGPSALHKAITSGGLCGLRSHMDCLQLARAVPTKTA
jgi:hypothetical protein